MKRRNFIKTTSGSIAGMSLGGLAFGYATEQHIKLGIDCYSLRAFNWKADQLIDYAVSVNIDMIQLNLGNFESLEDAYISKVKEHADRAGVAIEPGINSICPLSNVFSPKSQGTPKEYMLKGLRLARIMGAKAVRCFVGQSSDRDGKIPIPAKLEATIESLRSIRSQIVDAGIKFALENHGDLLAREMKIIIEGAGADIAGCCIDTGNSVALAEDPMLTLEVLGPYAITTHIRDSVVYEHPRGAAYQWVALGDGSIDFRSFVARYREICPQAPFLLESITGSPPRVQPYLEPEYWKAFPDKPAADFARFLELVKNGHPFTGNMMIAQGANQPPEYTAALKEQQRFDLERGLEYSKKTLDMGVRWRKS